MSQPHLDVSYLVRNFLRISASRQRIRCNGAPMFGGQTPRYHRKKDRENKQRKCYGLYAEVQPYGGVAFRPRARAD
jgi:hypothetical protein